MCGYEYEESVLLVLRLLKFLHQQNSAQAKAICDLYANANIDGLYEAIDGVVLSIFPGAFYEFDEEWESSIAVLSHPDITRFCHLSRQWTQRQGFYSSAWQGKLQDIAEYFACGVFKMNISFTGDQAVLRLWLSSDYYDPLSFGNSMVDMLLYIRQENQRLEEHLGDALYARQQNREEAA